MNLLTRGLAIGFLGLGLLSVSGCSEDNEAEASKLGEAAGDPGAPAAPKTKPAAGADLPPPSSSDEAFKRNSNPSTVMPSDYPNASKLKTGTPGKKE